MYDVPTLIFVIAIVIIARGLFYVYVEMDAIERLRVLKIRLLYRMYNS